MGHPMLERLEAADRNAELAAFLQIGKGALERFGCDTDELCRGADRRAAPRAPPGEVHRQ